MGAPRYTSCPRCDAKWLGLSLCHCAVCHRTFTGITNFDAHRVFGVDEDWDTRRCMTEGEIAAAGMVPNHNGHYMKPALDKPAHWTNKKEKVK